MTLKFFKVACFFICLLSTSLQGAIIVQNGKIRDADEVATLPVQEHFSLAVAAMNRSDWDEAARNFKIVVSSFPLSTYAADSHYYLGVSLFNMQEFDLANGEFSAYLKAQNSPKFFENSIEYKFMIAEQFKAGARRHLFGAKMMPKWASAQKLALETYDEVIAAMPCHEIAAKALFSKANLLWEMKDYRESVECFQMVVKRFPKNELAPESHLAIIELYLEQSEYEFQNPDILALAQINLRRFELDFPREERLAVAKENVAQVKEIYARGLYDTGQFYERVKKPNASILYYRNAINQFPDTQVAQLCKKRLGQLQPYQSEG